MSQKQLDQLPCTILAALLHWILGIGIRHFKNLPILVRCLLELGLEVFELDRRDEQTNLAMPVAIFDLVVHALVVNGGGHDRKH